MTILDALKGLYAKLGGQKSADNIQTIGEALEDITGVAVNGSDALPAVTAVDNGDVLTVVEGAWAKAAPSGGGGASVMFVDSTYDNATETSTLNKTFNEIYDAITNGTIVYIVTRFENDDIDQCGIANIITAENGVSVWYNSLNYYVYYAASGDDYPATANGGGGGGME